MKNYIKGAALAAMMVLSLASCRKESDKFHNYSYLDDLTWGKAKSSYGEKFKILWEGLNSNYAIWDYEKEHGLDWDAVYDKYYPKFTELDTLSKTRTVTDKEVLDLLKEVLSPLHDGHIQIQVQNHMTKNIITVRPNHLRVYTERREDYDEAIYDERPVMPNLTYYTGIPGKLLDFQTVDATPATQVLPVLDSLTSWADKILQETSRKTLITELEMQNEQLAIAIKNGVEKAKNSTGEQLIADVNTLALKYAYLNIPGVHVLDETLLKYGLSMTYALFEGNIAYLQFDSFEISPYIHTFPERMAQFEPYAQQLASQVSYVWYSWFNTIQKLHKAGQLGGVIIDVRGNGGGMLNDYQYVLGALLPSGGLHVMDTRMKRGVGRYDYSPLLPQVMPTYADPHVTVTEPIVVLANLRSVSMAEMTSMGTKYLDNAKLVGTRTWGGLCALVENEYYSYTYAGHIGIMGQTPVYVYCPCVATFDNNGKILEGVGVTPDIEVHLDRAAWQFGKGPDSQLDRAIQYITTGK